MSAGRYDFRIERGTSFTISFTYKDSDGNPYDLTDWCGRLTWLTNTGVTQIFDTENLVFSTYKLSIDDLLGKITIQFPAETTNNFAFSSAKYDLEIQSLTEIYVGGGSVIVRLLSGKIIIDDRYSQITTNIDCI